MDPSSQFDKVVCDGDNWPIFQFLKFSVDSNVFSSDLSR